MNFSICLNPFVSVYYVNVESKNKLFSIESNKRYFPVNLHCNYNPLYTTIIIGCNTNNWTHPPIAILHEGCTSLNLRIFVWESIVFQTKEKPITRTMYYLNIRCLYLMSFAFSFIQEILMNSSDNAFSLSHSFDFDLNIYYCVINIQRELITTSSNLENLFQLLCEIPVS